ncbi:GPI ethanolamine phosphate transferase 2 [Bulinus truncatus]|nr:GPI ethanolamine phosphate transferase 2 [Bulinus truncatus]
MLSINVEQMMYSLIKVSLKLPYTLLYCQLMGQSFFFFQGNSNSLSTLDLTAGYTGLNEFNPFITGFHICLSTFSGTIFWSLTFLKVCCLISHDKKYHSEAKMYLDVTRSVSTLLLSLSSRSSLYTSLIAIQRHHLFIWTVFSPKLLYESVYIIVHSILICFTRGGYTSVGCRHPNRLYVSSPGFSGRREMATTTGGYGRSHPGPQTNCMAFELG